MNRCLECGSGCVVKYPHEHYFKCLVCGHKEREYLGKPLCSCGCCVEMYGKEVYAPEGDPLIWKPDCCPNCGDSVGEPGSYAALGDEIASLRSQLDALKPEERDGRCWCKAGDGWTWGVLAGDNLICTDFDGCKQSGCPMTNDEGDGPYCGSNNPKPRWLAEVDPDWGIDAWGTHPRFCPGCGAHLGEDGIARRNADAARVERVRAALDELEARDRFARAFDNYTASERTKCLRICAAIRAALDPPQAALSNIQVAAEQAAAEASDMQRRLRMKPEDMTRRVTPLDPPTLGSLRGIAPDMTGDLDSVEFVRKQRDGGPEVGEDGN